jgi:hypothetical protein
MAFYEDTTRGPLVVEDRLISGVSQPHVNALLKGLRRNVITESNNQAAVRAIVVLGTSAEPGTIFFGTFRPRTLDVQFRSKVNTLDIDAAISDLYGNIRPGLMELRQAGMDEAVTNYWLDYFRKDNGLYRVYVAAAMCIAGATRDLA